MCFEQSKASLVFFGRLGSTVPGGSLRCALSLPKTVAGPCVCWLFDAFPSVSGSSKARPGLGLDVVWFV